MPFDNQTRNRLARLVSDARNLLTDEFTKQLQEVYGIQPDGTIVPFEKLTHLSDEQMSEASALRDRVAHLASGLMTEKKPVVASVERMTREQSFTVLNRFAALRMCEERGIVQECVRSGLQSKGFQVYLKVAGSGLGDQYERYKEFLFCMFDEIAVDLGILFDRFSPFGLLFPREPALQVLLEIINDSELKTIWDGDETIGWIYQYFNSQEERRAMREASAAPRNSRELAVRNQFFTPRYVVEFLTDNTLGRIWYEMCKGNTALKEECRYLVRRPSEVFLGPGEKAPDPDRSDENLSQEELLKKPVYIEHRPLKDPRDIRMLDPACGSMHFGLYSFDLFECLYDEAWELECSLGADAFSQPEGLKPLRETYDSKDAFLRDMPRLIIERNIHGIDIDPRAVQISALAIWLRAQKSWQRIGLKASERPKISKSNIVTAEPMPGEEDMRREFTENLKPRVLGQLVSVVFEKMKLAGEAGSLLKIEEEIKESIAEAKRQWAKSPEMEQVALFPHLIKHQPKQEKLRFDVKGITDEAFWDQAEERILASLRDFAEQVENGRAMRRRLFAEDAARGFAFIDLCRKRYDVVVMNPPFGEPCAGTASEYLKGTYPESESNIAAVFIERGVSILSSKGRLGYIADKSLAVRSSYETWRRKTLLNNTIDGFVDGGWGVLDDAFVETHFVVLGAESPASNHLVVFFDIQASDDKESNLIKNLPFGNHTRSQSVFQNTPNSTFIYQLPNDVLALFRQPRLDPTVAHVRIGSSPGDAFRFYRYYWETPPLRSDWLPVWNGGEYSPFYRPAYYVIRWSEDGREFQNLVDRAGKLLSRPQNLGYYKKPGLSYGKRGHLLNPHVMNSGCGFTDEGQAIIPVDDKDAWMILGYLNSILARALVNSYCGQHKHSGYVRLIPIPLSIQNSTEYIAEFAKQSYSTICNLWNHVIEHSHFICPWNKIPISLKDHKNSIADIARECAYKLDTLETDLNNFVLSQAGLDPKEMNTLVSFLDKKTRFRNSIADPLIDDTGYEFSICQTLDYIYGCIFGRWDIRFATGERQPPKLPDPFAPLPVCPPGMLQNAEGLPAEPKDVLADYPLRISWSGIIVDDENHPEDIVARVREALEVIWKDCADAIEHEACELLGVKTLRDYFSRPPGFFADHLKRYSKSRRKAPIYWPLSTSSGAYTLWIYYHRLTDQTLFMCVQDFVEPKIKEIERDIERLQRELQNGKKSIRDEVDRLVDSRQELIDFRNELLRVAKLPYKPNLNDGVMISACPLWKLFRHNAWSRDLKDCWEKMEAGEYDWAHLAYCIWPDRVREVCKRDRSIAIAHGLEDLYQGEMPRNKKAKGKRKGLGIG